MTFDPKRSSPANLSEETDADLLTFMSLAADAPDAARAAWGEFYRRHVEYLYAACLRAYAPILGGEAGAADLAAETLKRAYEHAGTFDAGGVADPERLRLRTRAWLGRIAQRLAQDVLRGRAKRPARFLDAGQWQQIAGEPAGPASDGPAEREATGSDDIQAARIERVRQAIASLTEREQTVIRVTFQWHEPGAAHQRLPNDVAEDLAAAIGTTSENLRQIRRRAMKKIEAFLLAGKASTAAGVVRDEER